MKLLASDYDGTLSFNASVMPEDKQAIEKWQAEGNIFAVVTGRSKDSLERQLKENGIEVDYMICNCGSMVYDAQGQLLESIYFDYVTGIDTIYIAKATEGVISVIANDENGRHRLIVDPDLQDHRFEGLEPDMKEEEIMDLPHIAQVVVSMATPDLAFEFAEDINAAFSNTLDAYANGYCVDIVPKGVSKATGVEFVQEYENIALEDVYTIGNAYNDIPLIQYGYHGGAMFTAPEEVSGEAKGTYYSVQQYIDEIK